LTNEYLTNIRGELATMNEQMKMSRLLKFHKRTLLGNVKAANCLPYNGILRLLNSSKQLYLTKVAKNGFH
jgi:hypothetical protein